MKALTIIQLCAREYNDVAYERIKKSHVDGDPNWLDWLNNAQLTVVLVRPDANSVTQNLTLVSGTRQTLPTGTFRMLAATRNMGANGTTAGKIVRVVTHEEQDAVNLDWHTETAASPVREIIYDDKKDPLTFWTRPPAVANWTVEAILSKEPTELTDPDNDDISVSSVYSAALQEWMLYRGYLMATQSVGNFQKAQFHFQAFFNLLGVKLRGELFGGPYTRAQMPMQAGNG